MGLDSLSEPLPPSQFWALIFLKKTMHKQNGLHYVFSNQFWVKRKKNLYARFFIPVFSPSINLLSPHLLSLPTDFTKNQIFFHDCPTPPNCLRPKTKYVFRHRHMVKKQPSQGRGGGGAQFFRPAGGGNEDGKLHWGNTNGRRIGEKIWGSWHIRGENLGTMARTRGVSSARQESQPSR